MMFLHNDDLNFLSTLQERLAATPSMKKESETLSKMIDRLSLQREKDNEKIKLHYREKRKIDKNYGRPKKIT